MRQITKEDLVNVYDYSQCYESTSGTQGKELVDYCLEVVNKIIKENKEQ
jgi:hypothetical protein